MDVHNGARVTSMISINPGMMVHGGHDDEPISVAKPSNHGRHLNMMVHVGHDGHPRFGKDSP